MADPKPELAERPASALPEGEATRLGLGLALALVCALLALAFAPPQAWRVDALVAEQERAPADRQLVWLKLDGPARSGEARARGGEALRATALVIARELGARHLPLAAPPADVEAWLDAHALYLLPPSEHAALGERLERDAMAQTVQALHARLSSPIFGVAHEEARRDPLGVRALLSPFLQPSAQAWPSGARPSARGDLVAADEASLLMEVRGTDTQALDAEVQRLLSQARESLRSGAAEAEGDRETADLGEASRQISARTLSFAGHATAAPLGWTSRAGLSVLAAFLLGLLLARRHVLRVIAACSCAGLGMVVGAWAGGPWGTDPSALPPFALSLGALAFGACAGVSAAIICDLKRPTGASTLSLALAVAPLLALPYPYLRGLVGPWALALCISAAVAVLARSRFERADSASPSTGASSPDLEPKDNAQPAPFAARRGLALGLLVFGLALSGWAITQSPTRGVAAIEDQALASEFREAFFDPQLTVQTQHQGDSAAAALRNAAIDQPQFRQLLDSLADAHGASSGASPGASAVRSDGPGAYVLAPERLAKRRQGLSALKLPARMQVLRDMLEAEGFRPEAFTEFLAGAADIESTPDAQAAIDGQLGGWISGRMESLDAGDGASFGLRTRLQLDRPRSLPPLESLAHPDSPLRFSGPAQHLARDAAQARERLLLSLATAAWIIALLVWLVHRQLGRALFIALAAVCGGGLSLCALRLESAPYDAGVLLPMCIVMGLCAFEANEALSSQRTRATRRPSQGRQAQSGRQGAAVFARTLAWVVGAAWMAAQADPWLHQWGLMVLVGAGLGSGLAYFVARFAQATSPAPSPKPASEAPS